MRGTMPMPYTSVPGWRGCASYGASSTMPLKSLPSTRETCGCRAKAPLPARVFASIGFTPAGDHADQHLGVHPHRASISVSVSTSGPPAPAITMARIVVIVVDHSKRDA